MMWTSQVVVEKIGVPDAAAQAVINKRGVVEGSIPGGDVPLGEFTLNS